MNRIFYGMTLVVAAGVGLTACQNHPTVSQPTAATPTQTQAASQAPAPPAVAVAVASAACDLLTPAEVTKAAGETMLPNHIGNVCAYRAPADPGALIYIQLYTDQAAMAAPRNIDPQNEQHLAGLGDEGFWVPRATTVFVRKGGRAFTISSPSSHKNSDGGKAKLIELAQSALAHL